MYNIDFYEETLGWIKFPDLKHTVKKALEAAPAWFWTAPSSSTSKYHPPDNNGDGGLCRHTVKAVWIGAKLAECYSLPQDSSDMINAALHLHDWDKFGPEDEMELGKDRPHYKNHGVIGASLLDARFNEFAGSVDQAQLDRLHNLWIGMCGCIRTHMGKWGTVPPYTIEQQIVHIADVISAHKELVALKFYDPNRPVEAPVQTNTVHERLIERGGETFLNFGKHKGKNVKAIIDVYPGYADWILSEKYDKEDVKEAFQRALEESGSKAANSGKMPSFSGL